jgi:hypothetical protein
MNRIYTALALIAIAMTACKKSNTETPIPDPTQPEVTMKLKRTIVTGNGSIDTVNFSYANDGLLSGYASTNGSDHTSFAYDNDKNLVAVDETEGGFHNVYTYTYSNGKPVSEIFKSWQIVAGAPNQLIEDDRLAYTVVNNRVTKIHLDMLQDNSQMDFVLTYNANGDVSEVKSDGSDFYKASFTYGNNKSPYPVITRWVLDQAGFSLHFYTRRDLLSASYDFPGTNFDQTQSTTYTYNNAHYPATATSGNVHTVFEYQ